jgi:uncharacterized membrane protein YraQ (UPF0718 family)
MVSHGVMNSIRPYFPVLTLVLIAFLMVRFPLLAVALVVGGLLFFAVIYATVVHKMRQARRQFEEFQRQAEAAQTDQQAQYEQWSGQTGHQEEPTFKNVTIQMVRRGKWFTPE